MTGNACDGTWRYWRVVTPLKWLHPSQNTWFYYQRRQSPLLLVTYGVSRYDTWAPDGTPTAAHPGGAGAESVC